MGISKGFTLRGTARTEGVTRPLAKMSKEMTTARRSAEAVDRSFGKLGASSGFLSSRLSKLADRVRIDAVGALKEVVSASVAAAEKIGELADESVKTQAVFDNLPFSIGAASSATKGLIDNMSLATAASKASRLGVTDNAIEFGRLAAAAQKLGQSVGQDAAQSVDDLTVALGRASPKILDNLGVFLKLSEAQDRYAVSLGKTRAQLTDSERAEAFRVEGLKAVFAAAESVTLNTDGAAAAVKRFNVEIANTKTAALGGAEGASTMKAALVAMVQDGLVPGNDSLKAHGSSVKEVKDQLEAMGVSTDVLSNVTLQGFIEQVDAARAAVVKLGRAADQANFNEQEALSKKLLKESIATELHEIDKQILAFEGIKNKETEISALRRERFGIEKALAQSQGDSAKVLKLERKEEIRQIKEGNALLNRRAGPRRKKRARRPVHFGADPGELRNDAFVARTDEARRLRDGADPFSEANLEAQLERQRTFEAARAEVVLNERMRGIEMLQASGADPLMLIDAEEQARVQFLEGQLARSTTEIEQGRIEDQIEAQHHRATLARLKEEEKARAKRAAMLQLHTGTAINALEGVGRAALGAALNSEQGVRASVHSFARSKGIEMGILAVSETARGVAAAASPLTAALAPGHFAAAGQAAAAGASFGVLAGATFSSPSAGPSAGAGFGFAASPSVGSSVGSTNVQRSTSSAPVSRPSGAGASATVQSQAGSASGRGSGTTVINNNTFQALGFSSKEEIVAALRRDIQRSEQDVGRI